MVQEYEVKLDTFQGPLDLLLHLIKRYEIDIYDIPVAEITEQYLQYIQTMKQLELNVASEYLVMAATLLAIKSQMLLPKQEIDEDSIDDYEEDPREALVQRLLEYRKFKEAAQILKEKEIQANQIYTRTPTIFSEFEQMTPNHNDETNMYDMLHALSKLLRRKQWETPMTTSIHREEIPIEERMEQVLEKVHHHQKGIAFDDMFTYRTKSHIVITFIAILELMKNNKIRCEQASYFDDLYIFPYDNEEAGVSS